MLIEAMKEITNISDKEDINSQNYFEAVSFIGNLHAFINRLKMLLPIKEVTFLPTFKGAYTCEKFGLVATEKENELKLFKVKSHLFLEDNDESLWEQLLGDLGPDCESIYRNDDVVTFILK